MLNEKDFFWKNFRLGTELQISGSFIYNAIYALENMQSFHLEEECFEFLYNIAVGLERLEKIAIILIEHDQNKSQVDFEKSLITHDHLVLLKRIKQNRQIKLGKNHTKFFTLLNDFYRSTRYERFNISSVYRPNQDKEKLVDFIKSELNIEIINEPYYYVENTKQIKHFIGKTIGKITSQLYEIIRKDSYRIGTFTYEIAYNSKAFKIFLANEFNFEDENLMQREVLLYILKNPPKNVFKDFIESIEPLKFDQYHTNKYLESILNMHKDRLVLSEMKEIYEEQRPKKERFDEIMAIGSEINFDDLEDNYSEFE